MDRVYNFSAGPACLPEEVLKKAQSEMLNYGGSGMSVMEMSHRSRVYQDIYDKTESDLRALMNIPENYKVMFLQGGASLQFEMVPMNLMHDTKKAMYVVTGAFAKKAAKAAQDFGEVIVTASSADKGFTYIPELTAEMFAGEADYVHITQNNTIYGTHISSMPDLGGKPLVSDMSSSILSEEVDVTKYGLIYAGAQKNIGPAGVTVVIMREDLIGKNAVPAMLDYKTHADNGSMYNTPPTYGIYIAGLVFEHLLKNGGIPAIHEKNVAKAKLLYDCIDNSSVFKAVVPKAEDRSIMNATFVTGSDELDKRFVAEAAKVGLVNLKGHRSAGGMRASIYNAMPTEGVQALVDFMHKFESEVK